MGADFSPPHLPWLCFYFCFVYFFVCFCFVLGCIFLHGFRNKTLEWLLPLEEHMVHIDEVIKIQDIDVSKVMGI